MDFHKISGHTILLATTAIAAVLIAVAMKTLGYVNQFGRGIEMVQEELEANKKRSGGLQIRRHHHV